MTDKKNIIIATVISILFFLLFPLNVEKNISVYSNESKNLLINDLNLPDHKIPYIYNNRAGYFSSDLEKSWSVEVDDGIALLNDGFINNSRATGELIFKDFQGNDKFIINNNGYPFTISNRLFIISRDRKTLKEVVNGKIKWEQFFNYIITSISGNNENISIGFMNGTFGLYNSDGERFYDYQPGGSRVPIIYSTELSEDSRYLGVISGLSPQRFILYERKELEYRPIYTQNLKDEVRRNLKIQITNDNRRVFIEADEGFYVVNIDDRSSTFIDDNFKLKNVEYIETLDLYMIHSGAVNYNTVKLITPDYRVVLENNFVGEGVSIKTENNSVYFVLDDSVIKLDIRDR